jgi:hypothetical protein
VKSNGSSKADRLNLKIVTVKRNRKKRFKFFSAAGVGRADSDRQPDEKWLLEGLFLIGTASSSGLSLFESGGKKIFYFSCGRSGTTPVARSCRVFAPEVRRMLAGTAGA